MHKRKMLAVVSVNTTTLLIPIQVMGKELFIQTLNVIVDKSRKQICSVTERLTLSKEDYVEYIVGYSRN